MKVPIPSGAQKSSCPIMDIPCCFDVTFLAYIFFLTNRKIFKAFARGNKTGVG
jgi:hypothetical protein